ncbi:MAG: DNA-formamidopyrimidine glycosylase family protein [Ilumatobacter sp.]
MPEGLEAEIWRRAAESLSDRRIDDVWVDERVAPDGFSDALRGRTITQVRRVGKVVVFETDGPTLGVHLGMTGRIEVDGSAPIERLEYASGADRPEWDRLVLRTRPDGAPALRMNDPRRLGRLSLDEDLSGIGPDALSLDPLELSAALSGRRAAIKTLLLDQHIVGGLGNLCADEVLLHAGIAPTRPADELSTADLDAIARARRQRLPVMLAAGGSTHGVLDPRSRADLGPCPLDGGPLVRATIGGRTAVWCADHQT